LVTTDVIIYGEAKNSFVNNMIIPFNSKLDDIMSYIVCYLKLLKIAINNASVESSAIVPFPYCLGSLKLVRNNVFIN
jgi:hypothetical protein